MKPTVREVITYAVLFVVASTAYFVICHQVTSPVQVFMPAWVPFAPWLAIPYQLQVLVSYFLVLAIGDRSLRHKSWWAYLSSFGLTCAYWFFYPTVMYRPVSPPGWWNYPYLVMSRLDLPVNVVPAGHILMPVILCWAIALDRPRWLWWLVPAQLLGAVAIVTTWQHRPIDLAIGSVVAVGAGLAFRIPLKRATS